MYIRTQTNLGTRPRQAVLRSLPGLDPTCGGVRKSNAYSLTFTYTYRCCVQYCLCKERTSSSDHRPAACAEQADEYNVNDRLLRIRPLVRLLQAPGSQSPGLCYFHCLDTVAAACPTLALSSVNLINLTSMASSLDQLNGWVRPVPCLLRLTHTAPALTAIGSPESAWSYLDR